MRLMMATLLLTACLPTKTEVDELVCGEGTHEEDGACVADSPDGDGGDSSDSGGSTPDDTGEADTGTDDTGTDDTGDDPGHTVCDDGVAPYDNLQDAVDDARDGDTITVCAGTWSAVEIGSGAVNLVGVDGAESTIIQGSSSEPAVSIDGETVSISGFTLQGRLTSGASASALNVINGDVTLTDLNVTDSIGTFPVYIKGGILEWDGGVFADNDAVGGIAIESAAAVTMRHLLLHDNVTSTYALLKSYGSPTVLENLIVHGNTAPNMLVHLYTLGSEARLTNAVFYDNEATFSASPSYLIDGDGGSFQNSVLMNNTAERLINPDLSMGYLSYYDNTASVVEVSGAGNLTSDPDLADPAGADFSLNTTSPCIDAGNPSSSYDDADGTRNDIGAFGGPEGSAW